LLKKAKEKDNDTIKYMLRRMDDNIQEEIKDKKE
jgi:hypothetical protein